MSNLDPRALEAAALAWDREDVAQMGELACARAGITAYLDALSSSPAAEPVAWLANGENKEAGWREVNRITFDRETVAQWEASPFWTVQPLFAAPVELDALRRELSVTKEISAGWQRMANAMCHERDEAISTVKRLRGTLEYIAAQAKQGYPTVLSVIHANAAAALDDDWQATVSRLSRKDTDND